MALRFSRTPPLYIQFEAGQHSGILLGDSGYAHTNFLFTPYLHPVRPEKRHYNQAHIHTRGLLFGIRKKHFQYLRNTLRFEPRRCCILIIATAVLGLTAQTLMLKMTRTNMFPWLRQPVAEMDSITEMLLLCSTSRNNASIYHGLVTKVCILKRHIIN